MLVLAQHLYQCQDILRIYTKFIICKNLLTFKNRASYIYDGHTVTLKMLHFIYFFQQL